MVPALKTAYSELAPSTPAIFCPTILALRVVKTAIKSQRWHIKSTTIPPNVRPWVAHISDRDIIINNSCKDNLRQVSELIENILQNVQFELMSNNQVLVANLSQLPKCPKNSGTFGAQNEEFSNYLYINRRARNSFRDILWVLPRGSLTRFKSPVPFTIFPVGRGSSIPEISI